MKTLQIRISEDDKRAAEEVLLMLGIDLPTAVRMYLKKIAAAGGIPFSLGPNIDENGFTAREVAEILQAKREAEHDRNIAGPFSTPEELIAELKKK